MIKQFKIISIFFFISIFLISARPFNVKKLPSVTIKTLSGKNINSAKINNGDKPMILALWAVWCPHCHKELININDEYQSWIEETGIKLVAVSIDDSRNSAKVEPYINGKEWQYEVYLDINSDLKRALNVISLPYIALLNKNGEIVYERFSYFSGEEDDLFEKARELLKN